MAGATELFRLSARLVLDTDGFDAGIASAKKQVQGMGSAFDGAESKVTKLSSAMNVAKGVAGVAGKVLKKGFDIGKELVGTAASIKALDESMAVTFEGIEERAAAAFKAVSEENNIAERRLQESGLAFFRQFSGAGMDSANAMMNMENALQLAADAAAAYDISLEDASSMIRSFVRGNVEAGESIGVFVNEQKRNELAMEQYGKKWKDLTEAERQFLLLDLVEQTYKQNKVLGQGAREADNYSNVVGNLASAWTDAMGKMGEKALPPVTESLQKLTDWITENPLVFETIGSGFGWIADKASMAVGAVSGLATALMDMTPQERNSTIAQAAGGKIVVDPAAADELKHAAAVIAGSIDKAAALYNDANAVIAGVTTETALPMANAAAALFTSANRTLPGADLLPIAATIGTAIASKAVTEAVTAAVEVTPKPEDTAEATLPQPSAATKQVLFDQYGNRRTFRPSSGFYVSPEDLMDTSNLPDVITSAAYQPVVEVQAEPEDTAEAKMQRVMDTWNLVVSVKGRWAGWYAGGPGLADTVFFDDNNGGAGQFARGLDRVPYDKFPAWLDRDESVLNRVEAEDWRASKRGKHTGFGPEAIGNAVKAALAGVNISMDGRTVGALVTPYVSREQAAEAWRRR